MVMELLEGRDLGTLVDQEGPLAPDIVAHYLVQACTGIAEAHARGMIHRDLKPGNLFLERRPDGTPFIKILDFGIAKFSSVDFKLTETKSVVGSPSYMAPEQLRSSKLVDTRTDIWALGIVMYELLTEKLPFDGDSMPELVLAITTADPPPLPDSVPPELAAIVRRCLDKEPDRRFPDVAALAEALHPLACDDPKLLASSAAQMLAKKPGTTTKASLVVDELLSKQTKHTTLHGATGALVSRSVPRTTLGLALALLVAIGVIAFLFLRRPDEPARTDVPSTASHVPLAPADAAAVTPADASEPAGVPIDAGEPDAAEPEAVPPDAAPTKHHGSVPHHTHHTPHDGSADPDWKHSRY